MPLIIKINAVVDDKSWVELGEYEFLTCPRVGEKIQIAEPMGDLEIVKVVGIEHQPAIVPKAMFTPDPEVVVFVER